MTQDEIIEMARQAGGREMVSALTHPNGPTTAVKFHLESGTLEAFAKLVADKEREALLNVVYGYALSLSWNEDFQADIRARGEA